MAHQTQHEKPQRTEAPSAADEPGGPGSGLPPSASATHHEHIVRPQHTNAHGTAFGGEVVGWVDIAAAACAMRHSRKAVVTASIDALHFLAPIRMGWIVCLDAAVNYTSRSSCEVGVRVSAFDPISGEHNHTASAYLTFVALDANARPTPMPPVRPQTAKEKERYAAAKDRREVRLELKAKLQHRVQGEVTP
jgi:acyl-CoA hydrolase